MGAATEKKSTTNSPTKRDKVKSVEKPTEVETKSNGFFKLKSWKATLVIVVVSNAANQISKCVITCFEFRRFR